MSGRCSQLHDAREPAWWAYPAVFSASGIAYGFGGGWIGSISAGVFFVTLIGAIGSGVEMICDAITNEDVS